MEQKYDSMGVLFEKQIINDHIIFNPVNVVRCNPINNLLYDVEFMGEISSVYEGDFTNQSVCIGFVTKKDDLIKKYGSLNAGILALQEDTYPYILIQAFDDIMEITRTYKFDMFTNQVYKIAEYNQEDENLTITNKQVDIITSDDFKNIDFKEAISKRVQTKTATIQNNSIISMKELYLAIKENIIGQDETIKQIVSTIDRNYNIENYRQKTNILLIGPSGSGKTEMFRTIASVINVPITIEDSEQYSAVGYYGASVEEMLIKLYHSAKGNLKEAEKGIIVIDEIDKKITGNKDDVSGNRVLNAILTMMEGSNYRINTSGSEYNPNYVMFDTSKVTFILAGAFSDMVSTEKGMGINSELIKEKKYKDITLEDLNKYGLSSELLRRVSVYKLNELTIDDLVNIMKYSKNSALKEYYNYARKKDIKLYIDDKAIRKIAELSLKKKTGASGIKATLNELLNEAFFEVSTNENVYSSIRLTEKSVEQVPPYILKKKKK